MPSKHKTPDGMVSERTLRSLIRSIADRVKEKNLSAKQVISLLREQERLSEQLRQTSQEENIVALEFGTQEETSV